MRIERTGTITPLTPRLIDFLTRLLGAVSLDDIQSPQQRRIDYNCLRGLLAIELKTLEEAPAGRIDNLRDELSQRDDWPIFLGSAPMQSFINNMDDPEGVYRRVTERLGRAIINHLKKANGQFEAHRTTLPRRNMMRLVLFVNEDHEEYDPHTVSYILWHAVRRKEDGRPLYENIDGVLYLTERHATIRGQKLTLPIVSVEGTGCFSDPWKSDLLDFVAHRWAQFNRFDREEFASIDEFVSIEHVPDQMRRSDFWRLEYRRRPYLRDLGKEQLRDRFDENSLLSLLSFMKNAPIKLSQDDAMLVIRRFSDFTQEMGQRGIPITDFPYDPDRAVAAALRLKLPPTVISWLRELEERPH